MTTNALIWLIVQPSHLLLFTALVGVVFLRKRFGKICCAVAAVMLVVMGLFPTATLLMRPLEQRYERPAILDGVDGIIVLSGAEQSGLSEFRGQPQLGSGGDRLTTFLMLAAEFPSARLVHSGRSGGVGRSLLLGTGIDPGRIVFEERSTNTCENAENAKADVTPAATETWLLVTSAYHMPRAVSCFQSVGWAVVPYPADYRTGPNTFTFHYLSDNLENVDLAAHEWFGLVYYRLRGVTSEIWP